MSQIQFLRSVVMKLRKLKSSVLWESMMFPLHNSRPHLLPHVTQESIQNFTATLNQVEQAIGKHRFEIWMERERINFKKKI